MNFSLSHGLYCHQLALIKAWSDRVQLGKIYAVMCMQEVRLDVLFDHSGYFGYTVELNA